MLYPAPRFTNEGTSLLGTSRTPFKRAGFFIFRLKSPLQMSLSGNKCNSICFFLVPMLYQLLYHAKSHR
jgi:hypothetical protein